MSMNSAEIMQKMDAIEWQIQLVRDEIARGWAKLATKGLSFEERKPIRENLQKNISSHHCGMMHRVVALYNVSSSYLRGRDQNGK